MGQLTKVSTTCLFIYYSDQLFQVTNKTIIPITLSHSDNLQQNQSTLKKPKPKTTKKNHTSIFMNEFSVNHITHNSFPLTNILFKDYSRCKYTIALESSEYLPIILNLETNITKLRYFYINLSWYALHGSTLLAQPSHTHTKKTHNQKTQQTQNQRNIMKR